MNRLDLPARTWTPLRRALLDHYDEHKRALPWRGESDPYRILVSEVMLQQTRVETVLGFYDTWLQRFPDFEALASAEPDEVIKAWEGLGYYRRARNLQRTATMVMERPDRSLPGSYAELRELPGIGEYTAGAVASIAFGEPVPAPDGNVRRVLARLLDVEEPTPAWLRATAEELMDANRPGDWNQALMDLGATICTPRGPLCGTCPVLEWCAARASGTQEERPKPPVRKQPKRVEFSVAVVRRGTEVLLERRPDGGLLGGMWAFPEREASDAAQMAEVALQLARSLVGAPIAVAPVALPACEHRFTHLHATYHPYMLWAPPDAGTPVAEGPERRWVDSDDPAGIALPVAQRRILESIRTVDATDG